MIKQIGSFVAKDASGKAYKILICQKFVLARELNAPDEWLPNIKSLKSSTGERVSGQEKGKYLLWSRSGMVELTSDDPNAI